MRVLDDGLLLLLGGAAPAVPQLLLHGDRLAEESAGLGRVALRVLDDGQLVLRGGAAPAVPQLLLHGDRLAEESAGLGRDALRMVDVSMLIDGDWYGLTGPSVLCHA